MKRKACELVNEDDVLSALWIHTANICRLMNESQFNAFASSIETQFVTCSDTEIGEFLEEFIYTVQATNDLETHQDIQSLIDDYDINEDMLFTIGSHINSIALQSV